jgi:hypothetical protein
VEASDEQWDELLGRLRQQPRLAPPAATGSRLSELEWPVPNEVDQSFRVVRKSALLPSFTQAWQRRRSGRQYGEQLEFLGLDDLTASLESSRESDWRLLGELERVADERRLEACEDRDTLVRALCNMRSTQGFERAHALGYYNDAEAVAEAARTVKHPVSQAFLLPFQAALTINEELTSAPMVRTLLEGPLRHAEAGEMRHLGLVEAVRRAHRLSKMAEHGGSERDGEG